MQQSNSSKGRCLRSKQARNLTTNDLLMYELIYYKETSQPHSDLNYKHFLNFMCHTHTLIATEVTNLWLK